MRRVEIGQEEEKAESPAIVIEKAPARVKQPTKQSPVPVESFTFFQTEKLQNQPIN